MTGEDRRCVTLPARRPRRTHRPGTAHAHRRRGWPSGNRTANITAAQQFSTSKECDETSPRRYRRSTRPAHRRGQTGSVCHPDPARLTHLQFRRFAGCPICNLHLQSLLARHAEITASGIHEVVVFHSTPEELRTYTGDLPFDVVADPDKKLYKEFGVETSLRGVLDPRATAPLVRNMFRRSAEPARSSAGAGPSHRRPSRTPRGPADQRRRQGPRQQIRDARL